jgi:hypothetical protein
MFWVLLYCCSSTCHPQQVCKLHMLAPDALTWLLRSCPRPAGRGAAGSAMNGAGGLSAGKQNLRGMRTAMIGRYGKVVC